MGRFSGTHYRNFYSTNGTLLPIDCEYKRNDQIDIEMPEQLPQMLKISSDLAAPFSHVRVDLYLIGRKIYFGEMTFFHNGGFSYFKPEKYDEIVGSWWMLPDKKREKIIDIGLN